MARDAIPKPTQCHQGASGWYAHSKMTGMATRKQPDFSAVAWGLLGTSTPPEYDEIIPVFRMEPNPVIDRDFVA